VILTGLLPRRLVGWHIDRMPNIEFSDEEHASVTVAVRRTIADDRYPHSPRLDFAAVVRSWVAPMARPAAPAVNEFVVRQGIIE
jgi:hypothetical protein